MVFSKSCCSFFRLCLIIVSFVAFQCNADGNQTSTLVVNAGSAGRPIPNTLFGISLEVGNYYAHIFKIKYNKAFKFMLI